MDKTMLPYALFIKFIAYVLFYKQGRTGISIFKTIVQEYYQAERGVTQGILMNERKSKKIAMHKSQVRKYTCCHYILAFMCIPALITMFNSLADQYIDLSFAVKEYQNTIVQPTMNENIYGEPLPMEMFPEETIVSDDVAWNQVEIIPEPMMNESFPATFEEEERPMDMLEAFGRIRQ
jgi:hypothetical protein